jgi:hypothetical protein
MVASVVRVELRDHLARFNLETALASAEREAATAAIGLLVDCLHMTSYDTDARAYFVDWHRRMGPRIARTAVVLDQPLWRIVVAAMGLAAQRPMASFGSVREAEAWLDKEDAKPHS